MKIFISYARENTPQVLALQHTLTAHEVWFDQRLSIGQSWWDEIERQIAACHCFVFVVSSHALTSDYCQKELDFALKLDKPIAPVVVEALPLPDKLSRFQAILTDGNFTPETTLRLLNELFEIERKVVNPLRPAIKRDSYATPLAIHDLFFATTNLYKKTMYEQILNTPLQTAALELPDIQKVDGGEVALHKAQQAYAILKKPVFVDHSGLAIRAWGGLPGGLTASFIPPAGLNNLCKMLHPFEDKYAEVVTVIAFTDGQIQRKFAGVVPGEIADYPRGNNYHWNNIFIPTGFSKTLGEMSEDEVRSILGRRRAALDFMRFLQSNYQII